MEAPSAETIPLKTVTRSCSSDSKTAPGRFRLINERASSKLRWLRQQKVLHSCEIRSSWLLHTRLYQQHRSTLMKVQGASGYPLSSAKLIWRMFCCYNLKSRHSKSPIFELEFSARSSLPRLFNLHMAE